MEGGGGSRSKYTIYILVGMSSKLLAGAWPEIITSFEGAAALQKTFFFPFKVNQASFLECGAVREPVVKTSSRGETEDAGGRRPIPPWTQRRREAHFSFMSRAGPPGRSAKDRRASRQTLQNK